MKSLVYVKGHTSNPESPVEPQNGRVYLANDDDEFWTLQLDESAYFTIHKNLCTKITEKNIATIVFHNDDEHLVRSYMENEMGIATSVRKIKGEDEKRAGDISASLGIILALDPLMGDAISELLSHIASTYGDKYEDDGFPMVDIYNLKYNGGLLSSGFNVGNATKYLKRYLTTGYDKSYNPADLKKAAQFLLFELANRQTDEENKA